MPAEILKLDAAYKGLRNTLVEVVAPEITSMFGRLGGAMKSLAASSPSTLKLGVGMAAAAVAAGPLLLVLGILGRVDAFALGGLNSALMLLLAPESGNECGDHQADRVHDKRSHLQANAA